MDPADITCQAANCVAVAVGFAKVLAVALPLVNAKPFNASLPRLNYWQVSVLTPHKWVLPTSVRVIHGHILTG